MSKATRWPRLDMGHHISKNTNKAKLNLITGAAFVNLLLVMSLYLTNGFTELAGFAFIVSISTILIVIARRGLCFRRVVA